MILNHTQHCPYSNREIARISRSHRASTHRDRTMAVRGLLGYEMVT